MLRLLILITFIILSVNAKTTTDDYHFLKIATSSLESNIESLDRGLFLSAGRHHFKSFWTRDFCWASRGLLHTGNDEVVKNHLTYLLDHMRADGLVPKVLDSMGPTKRVLNSSLAKIFPWIPKVSPITNDLKSYFVDENNSEAIDSNLMVLLTTIAYMKKNDDESWFKKKLPLLVKAYRYYDRHFKEGLIYQNSFSDWQDSVKRKGFTFLTNLIYYLVSRDLQHISDFEINPNFLENFKGKIIDAFYDHRSGLFKSMKNHPYISLDGNLLALEQKFLRKIPSLNLYRDLKLSTFFAKVTGWNTYPNYPYSWKSLATKIAFLPYHDRVYWSWLMAFSGKVAFLYGDKEQGMRIYHNLKNLVIRDQVVHEIYHHKTLKPWKSLAYDSEAPFSWGSAFAIDMIKAKISCCN